MILKAEKPIEKKIKEITSWLFRKINKMNLSQK